MLEAVGVGQIRRRGQKRVKPEGEATVAQVGVWASTTGPGSWHQLEPDIYLILDTGHSLVPDVLWGGSWQMASLVTRQT